MPSEQELAPHIEELTRALDNVERDKIRQQLERYLEYGVPIHQAKKDILTTFSGGRSVRKKIKNIQGSDQSVDLIARILSVDQREVTARGEQKTIWEGEMADDTGRIQYTSWVDHELSPGEVIEVSDGYLRTWQGRPQVNIGDNTDVTRVDDHGLPPLDELKDQEAPVPKAQAEEADVADLEPGMSSVGIEARILSVSERSVNVQGEPKTIWEGELADDSGRIQYTSWHDHGLESGQVLRIENAYVRSFRGTPQLNFGENSTVRGVEVDLPSADELRKKEKPLPSGGEEHPVKELRPGMNTVVATGRLLTVRERTVEVKGEPKTLWEGELADPTGRVSYTSWHDHDLQEGQVVRIENAYVRSFRGLASLNFGENSRVTVLDDDKVPPLSELKKDKPYTLYELEQAGGALGARVNAVILEIREGSGLILRCPECRRVLQKRECRLHGRVEGLHDLRIKAVVDDGTGAVTSFFNRSLTEKVLGRSLEECQEAAQEAMSRDIIHEEVEDKLLLRRVVLHGNASHDDYGTTLRVEDYTVQDLDDPAERAEELLDRVHVLSQEVAA